MGEDREISRTENPRVLDILCFSQNLNYIKVCKYIRELLCSPTPPPPFARLAMSLVVYINRKFRLSKNSRT